MDISELCHAWNRWWVVSNALGPSTRRLAWSYGENDSSPWTPVCWRSTPTWSREPLHNLDGTWQVAYTGWPVKSEQVKVWIFKRIRNLWVWPQADHATSTVLSHDEHCPFYSRPDNCYARHCYAIGYARHWEGTIWMTCEWCQDKNVRPNPLCM